MNLRSIPRRASIVRSWMTDRPSTGFSVTLEVCFRCNVRCVFCSRWSDPDDLSLEVIETIADDMAEMGAGYVSLTGGDPFVRSDIKQIIDVFAERKIPIHINTNGVLLRKYADFLRERAEAIRSITVSIDSPHPEVHDEIRGAAGTFRRAFVGMEKIRDVIDIDLACTLNQKNLHEIEEYAQFARERGFDFRFQPLHDDGENQLSPNQEGVEVEQSELTGLTERLESVLEPGDGFEKKQYYRLFEPFFRNRTEMDGLRCTAAARLIYFIDPKGDVYPCDTRRDIALGNVYKSRFAGIVTDEAATSWRATCRKGENGCWCMYACVAPANLRYQDLPRMPLASGGWPLKKRWARRVESINPEAAARRELPAIRPAKQPDGENAPFVSIVVASYNGGAFLQRTLAALFELDYPEDRFEVLLVDDAGNDGSVDEAGRRFSSERRLRIVTNSKSRGVAAAYNLGVAASDPRARYMLKIDNDLLVQPEALTRLVLLAEANDRAGIVGGRIYYEGDRERVQYLGGNLTSPRFGPTRMETPAELLQDPAGAAPRYLDAINSCMALIRRTVFERSGMFPEFYGRYEYEDYEFAFRARRLGFGSLYCPAAVGYHAVSLTSRLNDLSRLRLRLRARNGVVLMSRVAPRSWLATFVAYHLAKIPFDLLRHGHSPSTLLSGYFEGLRFAARGSFPITYLPASVTTPDPEPALHVVGTGASAESGS